MGLRAGRSAVNAVLIVAVAYAALVALGLVYDASIRRRYPARGRQLETSDGSRHVIEAGTGEAIVLLHGANGNATDFPEALIGELARDFRVFVPDRPGHGHSRRSATGRLDLAGEARALVALLDALGVQRAHLLGHSYGAALALRTALDAPGRILGVLAVAPIGTVTGSTRAWATLAGTGPIADAVVLALGVPVGRLSSPGVRGDAWYPASAPRGWSPSRAFPLSPIQILASLGNLAPLERDLAQLRSDLSGGVRCPALVLGASDDRLTPAGTHARALSEAAQGALPLEIVAGSGHWLPRTHVELVADRARALRQR